MAATARLKERAFRTVLRGFALPVLLGLCAHSIFASGMEPPPDRAGEIVIGHQRTLVLVPAGAAVSDYENRGYRLRKVRERSDGSIEVAIEVRVSAISRPDRRTETEGGARSRGNIESPAVRQLARALTLRLSDPDERARRLTSWVARNLRYRLDRDLPQTPEAVLQRRDAYCTGASRLLVALLRSAGLEAREVPGYAVAGTPASPAGFHRWVEYRARGGAWRFTDPLASFGFVPATFVRLSSESIASSTAAKRWVLLDHDDKLEPVGHDSLLPAGLRTVPVARAHPGGARVRISLPQIPAPPSRYRAVLKGAWIRERPLEAGVDATFVEVPAGSYEIIVEREALLATDRADEEPDSRAERVFERSLVISREQAHESASFELELSLWSAGPRVE